MQISCCGRRICTKGDVTDRMFEIGRRNLTHELNLVRMIRNQRMFENFVDEAIDKKEAKRLKLFALQHPLRKLKSNGTPDLVAEQALRLPTDNRDLRLDSVSYVSIKAYQPTLDTFYAF